MMKKTVTLIGILFSSLLFAGDIEKRDDYLIVYKETAAHFNGKSIPVKAGVYMYQEELVVGRTDLEAISGGDSWAPADVDVKPIVVGYAPGVLSNTRNEIWAYANHRFFLLRDNSGNHLNITEGVPLELIPAREGTFYIVGKDKKVIFRNHDNSKNDALKKVTSTKNIISTESYNFTLSRDGRSLIFYSDDNKIIRLDENGAFSEIATITVDGKRGPQASISGDSVFLPNGEDKVDVIDLSREGKQTGAKRTVFTKREGEGIVFYKNDPIITQDMSKGGNAKYIINSRGQLTEMLSKGRSGRKDVTAEDLNQLRSYAEDWRERASLGKFSNVVPRKKYVDEILTHLTENQDTWINISGPDGVGKSSLVQALANRLTKDEGSLISELQNFEIINFSLGDFLTLIEADKQLKKKCAEMKGTDEEKKKAGCPEDGKFPLQLFFEAMIKKRIVWVMEDFLDDPKLGPTAATQSMDEFLKMLRQFVNDGRILIVTTAESSLWAQVEKGNPVLKNMGVQIELTQPQGMELAKILTSQKSSIEYQYKVTFDQGVLDLVMESSKEVFPLEVEPKRSIEALKMVARNFGSGVEGAKKIRVTENQARGFLLRSGVDSNQFAKVDVNAFETYLNQQLIGQKSVVTRLVTEIDSLKSGVFSLRGPLAYMFFMGPTGVGKTYSAQLVSDYLNLEIIEIEMNGFSGFDPDTKQVKRIKSLKGQPFVLLLDDVAKDDPSALAALRPVIETGIYAEGTDAELNLRNAIIIMTSNMGEEFISKRADASNDELIDGLGEFLVSSEGDSEAVLPRNIWSRIEDSVIPFRPLSEKSLIKIGQTHAEILSKEYKDAKGFSVEVEQELIEYIVAAKFKQELGAVPVKNTIRKTLDNKIKAYLREIEKADAQKDASARVMPKISKITVQLTSSGEYRVTHSTK